MTITVLDNMEYGSDAAAQAAYVSNSSHVYGVETETAAYVSRVVSDGGTIVSVSDIDAAIVHAKTNSYYDYLAGWYSPQFGVKKDSANNVSKYYDLSSGSNDASQATSSKRPVWTPNVLNGKASIVFNGALTQYFTTSAYSNAVSQPLTQIAIINQTSGRGMWTDGIASNYRNALLAHWGAPYTYDMYVPSTQIASAVDSVGITSIITGIFNAGSSALYRNGSSIATGTLPNQSLTGLTIGTEYAQNVCTTGNLYDVIVLSGDRTALISEITSFLNSKYAVY